MGWFDQFRKPRSETEIVLPKAAARLAKAQDELRKHYGVKDGFGISGAIVGEMGEREVIAAFGLQNVRKNLAGYDAIAPDGRTVQVKSTSGGGARFSYHEVGAHHLICLDLNLRKRSAGVIYNGPEAPVRALLGSKPWNGTASVSRDKLIALNDIVAPQDRLPRN